MKKVAFDVPSTSDTGSQPSVDLLDMFTSSVIYVHKDGLSEADYRKYKRYIVAYPFLAHLFLIRKKVEVQM